VGGDNAGRLARGRLPPTSPRTIWSWVPHSFAVINAALAVLQRCRESGHVQLMDLGEAMFAGASSYIVREGSKDRLL
jgi:hypothetical protein